MFIKKGRNGIKPLKAPKIASIPTRAEQLPDSKDELTVLQMIRNQYKENPFGFELCAVRIVQLMDDKFNEVDLTRPWRDGGRDAVGKYHIGLPEHPLKIEFALEAKCYAANTAVGVKPMSRLISRIKHRQFGLMVTTSYIDSQAYKEVIDDGHPILMITGKDISSILRKNGIDSESVVPWLESLET